MKVINETPDEIVLSRPSKVRTTLGIILTFAGGGLFLVTALDFSNQLLYASIAFIIFGIGLFIILLNAYSTVHINKSARTVYKHRRSIAGKKTFSQSFSVDDACRIEIRPSSKKRSAGPAEVFIVFSDGSEMRIEHAYKPMHERTEDMLSTAERVAGFLNISLHDLTKPES